MSLVQDPGANEILRPWLAARLPLPADLSKASCIGVARDRRLVAAVAFTSHNGGNCEISMAADSPRWATPATIYSILAYPFFQLGCRRVTCLTQRGNKRTRRFLEGIGFKLEGCIREWWADGEKVHDALVYGLLRSEFIIGKFAKGMRHA